MIRIIFIFVTLSLFTHFFGYYYWANTIGQKLLWILPIFSILYIILKRQKISTYDINHKLIILLCLIPLISAFFLFVNVTSLENIRSNFLMSIAFFMYFVMLKMKVKEKDIIISFTIFGVITFLLQIYQQYLSPIPLFGIIGEDQDMSFQRNGIYRYNIGTYFIAIFCLYYYWSMMLKKTKLYYTLLFLCFMSSIYLYVTRQIILSSLVTIMCSVFLIKNKKLRYTTLFTLCILSVFLFIYSDVLFGEFIQSYSEDSYTTDIRWKCINFIIEQMINNPILFFTGFGHDSIKEATWALKGYYLADIGIIGETYLYGIVWGGIYLYTVYLYTIKYRKYMPLYLKLYFIGTFLNSIYIFPYRGLSEVFIWISALYIGNIYISQKVILNKIKDNGKDSR